MCIHTLTLLIEKGLWIQAYVLYCSYDKAASSIQEFLQTPYLLEHKV